MFSTPVVFIVFNRPRQTLETFAAIRKQRPSKLLIIADGPRSGHPTDAANCEETRRIVSQIDWPCEVYRNFSGENLGCKQRVITGLNWVFNIVDRAIILEDDCLPNADFFGYCKALLERYENDARVMAITGDNFQGGRKRGTASYYFSRYNHVWGWATWKRAWQKNDPSIGFWPEWKTSSSWLRFLPDPLERQHWSEIFDRMYRNEIDTWDYPWTASVWYNGGLTATPNVNLVENIGFGPDATYTIHEKHHRGTEAQALGSLTHPRRVSRDSRADRYLFDHHFGGIQKRLHQRLLVLTRRIRNKVVQTFAGRAADQHS